MKLSSWLTVAVNCCCFCFALILFFNFSFTIMLQKENFIGEINGRKTNLYTLKNNLGLSAQITNYGAALVSISVPDKEGNFEDVVLGYENIQDYEADKYFHGAIVGRFANRIGYGKFAINNHEYQLNCNNGQHAIHGGPMGFGKMVWEAEMRGHELLLTYFSKDGEEGYPGNLNVTVTYSLTDDNALVIDYLAETDKPTVVNLTNHAYFNLGNNPKREISNHILWLNAAQFTPKSPEGIPNGEFLDVSGTPMDFTSSKPIGRDIAASYPQLALGLGYDHNFVLNNEKKGLVKAAEVFDPSSRRCLEVLTTMPGVQFYTADYLGHGRPGKEGHVYQPRDGFCLETQFFPDSPNKPQFPSTLLNPGNVFSHQTIYRFSVKG